MSPTVTTSISNAIVLSTLTHEGHLSKVDFQHQCIDVKTCVNVLTKLLTPEVEYGFHRPANVCQCCFCLGRVCYNFRPSSPNSSLSHWCDQCHYHKRSGCTSLKYHETSPNILPASHKWVIAHSVDVPALVFPPWYLAHVLQSRRSGEHMSQGIGKECLPSSPPPVLPVVKDGKATIYNSYKLTSSRFIGVVVPSCLVIEH